MDWTIISQYGHLCIPIGPKNTNLVEDVVILRPVKIRRILVSGCREVENFSANQRQGHLGFPIGPKKQTW